MSRTFQALSNYNYRLFFLGQIISLTGTWMQATAQAWLVLQLSNSAFSVGLVTTLQTLPVLLLTLFGGVFANRVPKRNFLVFTQAISALQALLLAVLTATGAVQIWHMYALALLLGTVNAFDFPTRQAFIIELVGREDLPNAVALNSSLFNAARIVGPAVGGVTIAALGVAGAFYANAASFVPVIAALLMMHTGEFFAVPHSSRGNIFRQVGAGLRFVSHTTTAIVVLIIMAVLGTFGYNFAVTLPLLAQFVFHTDAVGFGALTSFMGAGSLLGSLAIAARPKVTYRLLLGSSAVFSLFLLLVALSQSYLVTSILLVALGTASIAYTATSNTLLQLNSPDEMRGRVMSIYVLLFVGSTPIGGFLTGTVASSAGVPQTIAAEALICAAGVGIGVWYYNRHRGEIPLAQQKQPLRGTEPG